MYSMIIFFLQYFFGNYFSFSIAPVTYVYICTHIFNMHIYSVYIIYMYTQYTASAIE